jgi:hypothetical protein
LLIGGIYPNLFVGSTTARANRVIDPRSFPL